MMTSGGLSSRRIFSSVSSPSMPGSQMSSKTTSTAVLDSRSRQASPLSAEEAEYPSSARTPARDSRIPASSSTMRTLGMLSGCGYGAGLRNDRQLDNEARTNRLVLFDANGSVMVFDDTAHNGQSQAGAAFLGGKVGKKQLLLQFSGYAMSAIGDRDLNGVSSGDQCGCDFDFADQRILQGFSGVVHKIGDGAFHRLGINHHLGKILRQRLMQADPVQSAIEQRQGAFDDLIDIGRLRLGRGKTGQRG